MGELSTQGSLPFNEEEAEQFPPPYGRPICGMQGGDWIDLGEKWLEERCGLEECMFSLSLSL